MNEASATLVDKFAIHDKDGAQAMLLEHLELGYAAGKKGIGLRR